MTRFSTRKTTILDAEWMQDSSKQMGRSKPDSYFADCCRQQEEGKLVLLVAEMDGAYMGHVKVVWGSEVPSFRETAIPQIQDLAVVPTYRRKGIASQLVDEAENIIHQRSGVAGIRFELYADYGVA